MGVRNVKDLGKRLFIQCKQIKAQSTYLLLIRSKLLFDCLLCSFSKQFHFFQLNFKFQMDLNTTFRGMGAIQSFRFGLLKWRPMWDVRLPIFPFDYIGYLLVDLEPRYFKNRNQMQIHLIQQEVIVKNIKRRSGAAWLRRSPSNHDSLFVLRPPFNLHLLSQ